MDKFKLISSQKEVYASMLKDIRQAKKSIYLETYIYRRDKIGDLFRAALEKKAAQGVKVYLLIDALNSLNSKFIFPLFTKKPFEKEYFAHLSKLGGEVRFFKELKYAFRIFEVNHERNHRKLLIIDDKISYLGSINITADCLKWRELVLRIEGKVTEAFLSSFIYHWNLSQKLSLKKIQFILHRGFEIIQDFPADRKKIYQTKYLKLIKNSKNEILIETPYFVPPLRIRHALKRALKRKVRVKILLPYKSDQNLMDRLRNRYLGSLYKKGAEIFYYTPNSLHSKILLVDKQYFILGSSNLDYRSLSHQYEINLFGQNKEIVKSLLDFFNSGLKKAVKFNYPEWKERSSFKKIIELLLSFVAQYL